MVIKLIFTNVENIFQFLLLQIPYQATYKCLSFSCVTLAQCDMMSTVIKHEESLPRNYFLDNIVDTNEAHFQITFSYLHKKSK